MKRGTQQKPKGLTDKELIAKYDTGKKINFDKVVMAMAKNR
jgi:hypothetical protein